MPETFVRLTRIEALAEEAYAWHLRRGAFERLAPPWIRIDMADPFFPVRNGARTTLQVKVLPWPFRWDLERTDCIPGQEFTDVQVRGPFRAWRHRHLFERDGTACFIEDRVEYELPREIPARAALDGWLRAQLERCFLYRHRVLARDLAVHRSYHKERPLRIFLTGASGFIGTPLRHFLSSGGHQVICATRHPHPPDGWVSWNPTARQLDVSRLNGVDAVIHLAGHPIFPGRWTAARRKVIEESRVDITRWLAETLARLPKPPSVFITASAIGYYGDRGAETLDEDSPPGKGFLPRLCFAWEEAAQPAAAAGIRTVHLRFGVVLSPAGGLLRAVLPIAKMGLAGPIGGGHHFMSWIAMDDAVEAIYHSIWTKSLRGPVNVVSPTPTTQRELFRTLAFILGRPFGLPTPAFLLRPFLGDVADEVILSSSRVQPAKLQESGFLFQFAEIEAALRHVLGHG